MAGALAAGTAVVLFLFALAMYLSGGQDKLVGGAIIGGLLAMSVALADHINSAYRPPSPLATPPRTPPEP